MMLDTIVNRMFQFSLLMAVTLSQTSWASVDSRPISAQSPQNLSDVAPFALGAYGPTAGSPSCIIDSSDPYDPGYVISDGKYKGQCLDASTVRPPIVLKEDGRHIVIANFYHDGKFWLADIPKNAVTSVMFQGVPFGDLLFGLIQLKHGQFRFKLNQPIYLREQSGNKTETVMLDDIIVSATATHPKGIPYSALHSKDFGIATRVLSSTSRGVEEIAVDKSDVHQYELELPNDLKSDILLASVVRASEAGYLEHYHLLDKNCATVSIDSLDAAIERPQGVRPFRGSWLKIHDEIEKPALQALRERKIKYTRVQNMNDEMTCAMPGEKLGDLTVDQGNIGRAAALCRFNTTLVKPEPAVLN
jgi:hypothetical protein